jgi:DNA-directed RNA polymerase subunit omega
MYKSYNCFVKELAMARITVEDCVTKVADRFELVVIASERAKELTNGTPAMVARDHDKSTVIALREIAEEKLNIEAVKGNVVLGFRNNVAFKDLEEDTKDIEFIESEIMGDVRADKDSTDSLSNVSEEEINSQS